MARLNRHQKLKEIMDIATAKNFNKTTLIFLIATMSDKGLTKFYLEMKEKTKETLGDVK